MVPVDGGEYACTTCAFGPLFTPGPLKCDLLSFKGSSCKEKMQTLHLCTCKASCLFLQGRRNVQQETLWTNAKGHDRQLTALQNSNCFTSVQARHLSYNNMDGPLSTRARSQCNCQLHIADISSICTRLSIVCEFGERASGLHKRNHFRRVGCHRCNQC